MVGYTTAFRQNSAKYLDRDKAIRRLQKYERMNP